MVNTNTNIIYKYINYITLACIVPIGYFAPLGEWLLISFFSLSIIISYIINPTKLNLNNLFLYLSSILIVLASLFWTINPERTINVIGPISGIIIAIYITLHIRKIKSIKNLENIIGIPLILTSLCIFADITLNTEIRSSLASLAGDLPTSKSAGFGRGLIVITMIMPITVSLYLYKKSYFRALFLLLLVSIIVLLGPNDTAKLALMSTLISSIIIYFLGPKSFLFFGILSLLYILCLPIISTKIFSKLGQINYDINIMVVCTESYHSPSMPQSNKWYKLPNINKCSRHFEWQETPLGGSIIHRLLVWEYVGKQIIKKPFLGHGAGTSRLIGQNIILHVPNSAQNIKGGVPLHPHNNYLQVWLEFGILGIIIASFIWVKILRFGFIKRRESYVLGTGICSTIITIFVASNLSFGVFQAWWMASVGLIFLVALQSAEDKNKTA